MLANKNNHLIKKFLKKGGNTTIKQSSTPEMQSSRSEMQNSRSEMQSSSPEMQNSTSEMQSSRSEMQSSRSEMQNSSPEMQSSSPEIQSSSPEMQSSSPEMQSSRSEMQNSTSEMQYPDQKYLYKNISSQKHLNTIKAYVCAFNKVNFVKYIVDTKSAFPSFTFSTTITQKGGFLDDDSSSDDLDTLFQKNVTDFVKTFYENQTGSESLNQPEYIGYLLHPNEPDCIFVFVKTPDVSLKPEYTTCILNELFHTFKVYDTDVDESVKTLFENNQWLLNKDEPYSGYLCKLNEDKQLVNTNDEASLMNVDSIGDLFYFSFLPLDKENARLNKRYAIFPNDYVCILDETQKAEYLSDKQSYADDKSIYFKGEILTNKQEGHEFFCVKTPSQFLEY